MRDHVVTTSPSGLNKETLPYRLYEKAKRLGVWNPRDIDFSKDVEDWKAMTPEDRQGIVSLVAQFVAGEEAVTLDLLPLIMAIAREGRLEEEMFLTTFLFEEAKHTEFFRLLLDALDIHDDLSVYHTETYRKIFYEILPTTMQRLLTDTSAEAIADASVVYNMFVEGMLAETGYYSFYQSLEADGKMPGLLKGIGLLKRDESRHIGYGTFLLQRLICEKPELYDYVEKRLGELLPLAIALNQEGLDNREQTEEEQAYSNSIMEFSMKQFQLRLEKLQRAKDRTIEELYRLPEEALGVLS